jgi:RNA polymerase sigma factor (sigma-70 family)
MREGRVNDPACVGSYIFGICSKKFSHWAKFKNRTVSLDDIDDPLADDDPEQSVVVAEGRKLLEPVFQMLSPLDQKILILKFVAYWNYSKIGTFLDLTEITARKRASRAISRLRHSLAPVPLTAHIQPDSGTI